MAYDISRVKSDLEGALHGTTVNQVTNLYGIFNRAARDVLADIDPAESKRIVPITNALYGNVTDYTCPSDLKGDRVIDIFPQPENTRYSNGVIGQRYNQAFDLNRNSSIHTYGNLQDFTIVWNSGIKSLRISVPTLAPYLITNCDSLTDNGTWTTGGSAVDLTTDTLNYIQGTASLKFGVEGNALTLEAGGLLALEEGGALDLVAGPVPAAYIENTNLEPVDLSDKHPDGCLFAMVSIPEGANITSFTLRWGDSDTDYWTATVTANNEGTTFQTGWNLLRFNWQVATEVGSPDDTSINYLRLTVNSASELITPIRVDNIFAQKGITYLLEYYSKYAFRDLNGAFKETVTADSDQLNLDTDSYQIFFNKVMVLVSQQVQGADALQHDGQFFQAEYDKSVTRYKNKYKSEIQMPQSDYYQMSTPGYSKYYGRLRW